MSVGHLTELSRRAVPQVNAVRSATGSYLAVWQGNAVHQAFAVLGERIGLASLDEVHRIAFALTLSLPESLAVRRKLAVGITTLVVRYQRTFWMPAMEYVAGEVPLGRAGVCDLLWLISPFGYLIDELKTGDSESAVTEPSDATQKYLEFGAANWPRFLGLRHCELRAPRHSATFAPDKTLVSQGPRLAKLLGRKPGR